MEFLKSIMNHNSLDILKEDNSEQALTIGETKRFPDVFSLPRLIDSLKAEYPDQSPHLTWSDREVWFKAGQVSVWKGLEYLLKEIEAAESQRQTKLK